MGWRESHLILRASTQLASDALLAMEKFVVGGHATVRGYRENQFVRDNGFAASAELRFPLFVDLGTSAEMWVRMQADYDLWEARRRVA